MNGRICDLCAVRAAAPPACVQCRKDVCADCSLPALRLDPATKRIVPGSDGGEILCAGCNPPHGGRNARVRRPAPVGGPA